MYVYSVFLYYWNRPIELQVNRLQSIGQAMYFGKTDLGFEFILTARRLIEDHCIMSVYIIIHKIYNLGHLGIDLQWPECIMVEKPSVRYNCEH